jgi:hypothetical protein
MLRNALIILIATACLLWPAATVALAVAAFTAVLAEMVTVTGPEPGLNLPSAARP